MKRILLFVLAISIYGLLFVGCTVSDNDMGDRAEKKWNEFVQKNLVGEWKPQQIEIKPIIGAAIIQKKYPVIPGCSQDVMTFKKDYTGTFDSYLNACKLQSLPLKWYHKFGEVGVEFNDGTTIRTIPLHKSENDLVVAIPLKTMMPYMSSFVPEVAHIDPILVELLFVNITFVK